MFYKIPDEYKPFVKVMNGDYQVKELASQLQVTEGWDYIPLNYVGASIIVYRGNNIYFFQKKLESFPGEDGCYQVVMLEDYKKNKGIEKVAGELAKVQGAIPRLMSGPGYNYFLN